MKFWINAIEYTIKQSQDWFYFVNELGEKGNTSWGSQAKAQQDAMEHERNRLCKTW